MGLNHQGVPQQEGWPIRGKRVQTVTIQALKVRPETLQLKQRRFREVKGLVSPSMDKEDVVGLKRQKSIREHKESAVIRPGNIKNHNFNDLISLFYVKMLLSLHKEEKMSNTNCSV